jgi:hypothetical protein
MVFGFELWVMVAVILSLVVVAFASLRLKTRGWIYRILLMMGLLSLIWGVLPILGGGKMSPYLVVGAIVAFGFLVLSESTGDDVRW